jgi:transposase
MLNMEEIDRIKDLIDNKGLSYSEVSRLTGYDRKTISKWHKSKSFPEYTREKNSSPVKDNIIDHIKNWIEEDIALIEKGKRKKIRSDRKMHRDLMGMGIRCSERSVNRYSAEYRPKEVFIEQEYNPGEDMQVDWGEIYLDFEADKRIKVYIFVATLPYSNSKYVRAYLKCDSQSFFDGHIRAFEFFGGIPKRIRYDNLSSAVKKVLKGSNRLEQDRMIYFKNFFGFETNYCNVAKGNEKGSVENAVGYAKRMYLSDNKTFKDTARLNKYLFSNCRSDLNNAHYRKGRTIKELLSDEIPCFKPIPDCEKFDNSLKLACKVRNTLTVQYDGVRYSVPSKYSGMNVTLVVDMDYVSVYKYDKLIARHYRLYKHFGKEVYDFRHYLPALIKKPGALPNAKCIARSYFPVIFNKYLDGLNSRTEYGNREMVKILMLHKDYKLKDIFFSMEWCYEHRSFSFDAVNMTLKELHNKRPSVEKVSKAYPETEDMPLNLKKYDKLIGV